MSRTTMKRILTAAVLAALVAGCAGDTGKQLMSSPALKIKLIGPRKMITDNISVTYGELKKGKNIDFHSNQGIEWTYIIEGRCEHKMSGESYIWKAGDSVSYDAKIPHSVTALETLKFIAIYIRDKE